MSTRARAAEWLTSTTGRRWILWGLLAYAVIGCVVWIQRKGDFVGYIEVGELLLQGRHIYHDASPGISTWPPFFSLVCVPLALLARPSVYLARGLWLLLNVGLLLLVLDIIAQLVYGRRISVRADTSALSIAAPEIVIPLFLADRYASGNFDHLQVNLVIFCLTLGGLYLQTQRREILGSFAIGLAIAMKVMPVVFIPYLAYRRQWRAAAYTTVAASAFSLSPILVFGWTRFWDYVVSWREAVAAGWTVGRLNQSVFAMWDRILGHGMVPLLTPAVPDLQASGSPLVKIAMVASVGLVTAVALWLFRDGGANDRLIRLTEWSVVFIVSAIFGPVTWKAYLVVLLLPVTVLAAVWRSPRFDPSIRWWSGAVLVAFFVLGTLPSNGYVGSKFAGRLEMASVVTIAALVMLGASFWLRARLREFQPAVA